MIVTITWGLPGSGKTTFCKDMVSATYKRVYVVTHDDFDKYGHNKNIRFIERLNDLLESPIEELYIDTLITTHDDFFNLCDQLNLKSATKIKIQYWLLDREACLWNDLGRRKVNSKISIKYMPLEKPNRETISNFLNNDMKLDNVKIEIMENKVIRKEDWKMFADEYDIYHNDGIMKSNTWSLGGTAGNCWSDNKTQISAEPPLSSFVEFDRLIEAVCPNISFIQYKNIYNKCVSTDTYSEGDYYGGSTSSAYYKCSIPELYKELVNKELI